MIGKRETDIEKERLRLAGLCARSEQCEHDIRTKLDKTSLSSNQKEDILTFLKDNKFIDDTRFAGSFVRDKLKFSKWGKRKIRFYLFQKHISASVIDRAIDDIDDMEYFKVAFDLIESKCRHLDINSHDDVAKLYRSMMTRGFSGDIIKKALFKLQTDNKTE